jgi:hypothetical protein
LEVDLLHTVEEILAQRFRAACEKLEDGARSNCAQPIRSLEIFSGKKLPRQNNWNTSDKNCLIIFR